MARIKMPAGANACAKLRETEAMKRNNIDIVSVNVNEIKRKKKKAPGSRRRLTMKYRTRLNPIEFPIL